MARRLTSSNAWRLSMNSQARSAEPYCVRLVDCLRRAIIGRLPSSRFRTLPQRKRAMEAVRESEEELRILHRVGATIASELDLKKLVQTVTDAGRELSQAEFAAFL